MTDDATYRKMKQERDLALAECERLKKINSDLCRVHNGHLVEAARLELECDRLRADLRDWFAMAALGAMIGNNEKDSALRGKKGVPVLADYAYEYADAMLAARAKP